MIRNMLYKLRSVFASLVFVTMFSACTDDVDLGNKINEELYDVSSISSAYVVDKAGMRKVSSHTIQKNDDVAEFTVNISNDVSTDLKMNFVVDEAVLEKYNTENETSYTILPEASYVFGDVTISESEGTRKAVGSVTFKSNDQLPANSVYILPLSVSFNQSSVEMQENGALILMVRDNTVHVVDTEKEQDIIMISSTPMNGVNPLHNLCYKLKGQNKYLFDVVILASSQIGFDTETQKAIFDVENDKHRRVFDNASVYIKPLKDAGMKVMLNLLGANKYLGGMSNISDDNIDHFVNLFMEYYKKYDLDGVMLDDEYTAGQHPAYSAITPEILAANPGLVPATKDRFSKFAYQMSKAIKAYDPDGLVTVFAWSGCNSGYPRPVYDDELGRNVGPGEYLDYAIANYGSNVPAETVTYMQEGDNGNNKIAPISQQFTTASNKYFASESILKEIVDEGYKANMIWSLNPGRTENWQQQHSQLELITKIFYNDELLFENNPEWIKW